jgi:hypothetical protein
MSGAVVATLLTMVVVPLLYWELMKRREGEPVSREMKPAPDDTPARRSELVHV